MAFSLLAILSAFAHPGHSVVTRQWTMEDGLPQSTVTDIAQTDDGLLVMGTFGGLVRFDGLSFEVWDGTGAGLRSIRITAVAARGDDTWVGTQDGRAYHVDGLGRVVALRAPSLGVVWDVVADPAGVWWATDRGLFEVVDDELRPVDPSPAWRLASGGVEGPAWVGESGLWVLEPEGPRRILPEAHAFDVVTWQGRLAVATDTGVLVTDRSGRVPRRLGSRGVGRLATGSDGRLWQAAANEVWTEPPSDVAVLPGVVRDLFVDREGAVWVGMEQHGLVQLRRRAFITLRHPGPLTVLDAPGEGYFSATCSPDGSSTVAHRRPGQDEELLTAKDCVRTMALVEGALWVAAEGVVRDLSSGRMVAPEGGHDGNLLSIASDGRWLGTTEGLFLRQGERWVRQPGVPGPVAALVLEGDGTLWVGAGDGVYRHREGGWTAWNEATGPVTTPVRDVWPHDGGAWAGSYGSGLFHVGPGGIVHLTRAEGLAEHVVSRILPDDLGRVWLLGNRGVSRLSVEELDAYRAGTRREVRARRYLTGEGSGGEPARG